MDETIIQAIINTQNTQVKAVLATIIRTEGSTPRDLGTQMLVMETGQTIGTIGGGTAEKLITKQALALSTAESEANTEIHRLEINQETIAAGIAVCGGNMEVLLEPVQGNHFWKIAQDLQMSKDVVLVTSLIPPHPKSILDSYGNVLWGLPQPKLMLSAKKLQEIYSSRHAEVVGLESEESCWLVEPALKIERLLILGAGHVARKVAFYANSLDFQVTVIDDRPTYALPEFFAGAYSVICSDFETGIKNYLPNRDTYVVIATWSHQTDADCLKNILSYSTKYVGMLGSTKKITAIGNYLQKIGYSPQDLNRLRAPVGLDINAQTPSEIAISIIAEIISVRRSLY